MGPKTRQKVESKVGGIPDIPEADLLTLRDIVRFIHKVELDTPSIDNSGIVNHVTESLLNNWKKVNPRLVILPKKTIKVKLSRTVDRVKKNSRGRPNKNVKNAFEKDLNKLYDICACSCKLEEVECTHKSVQCSKEGCEEVHILCSCPQGIKIPREERSYMKDQRQKVGFRRKYQLGVIDKKDVKREKKRQENIKRRSNIRKGYAQNIPTHLDNLEISFDSDEGSSFEEEEVIQRNYRKLDNFALECIRYKNSLEAVAAQGNALLKDVGILSDTSKHEVIDKCKMDRQKARVSNISLNEMEINSLKAIGFDSKKDKDSLVLKEIRDENGKIKESQKKEAVDHLTFTCEDSDSINQGKYLNDCDVGNEQGTGEGLSSLIYNILGHHASLETLEAVICDTPMLILGF